MYGWGAVGKGEGKIEENSKVSDLRPQVDLVCHWKNLLFYWKQELSSQGLFVNVWTLNSSGPLPQT